MMNDLSKQVTKQGTKISKEKLLDLLKRTPNKELACALDGAHIVVIIENKGR